jgi:hypothetical protein
VYRTCIFCAHDLGVNEVIEEFPVGSEIAFDAARGRLWAVCRHCARWNLAPIEERWEAVERAEALFRDSRLRVQSENIGLAKMRDGSKLVRIGPALQGEMAAWRYGRQLEKRRRNMLIVAGVGIVGGGLIVGVPILMAGASTTIFNVGFQLVHGAYARRQAQRIIYRLSSDVSPTGTEIVIRRRHLKNIRITHDNGQLQTLVPEPADAVRRKPKESASGLYGPQIVLTGGAGRTVAAKTMALMNGAGAAPARIAQAVSLIETMGSAQSIIEEITRARPAFDVTYTLPHDERAKITPARLIAMSRGTLRPISRPHPDSVIILDGITQLAFEMALHDESERRALEGELDLLEDAWREAESIARIADALPDEPPED